ncbi:hypothetical protein RclHR1_04330009 [Rhizophagus clarus]|nr:hypothetical protein RclHR1_04330009 [Rhizophagus clarus]
MQKSSTTCHLTNSKINIPNRKNNSSSFGCFSSKITFESTSTRQEPWSETKWMERYYQVIRRKPSSTRLEETTGWGASRDNLTIHDRWTQSESKLYINLLELKAIQFPAFVQRSRESNSNDSNRQCNMGGINFRLIMFQYLKQSILSFNFSKITRYIQYQL